MSTDEELINGLRAELEQVNPPAELLDRVLAAAQAPRPARAWRQRTPRRRSLGTLVTAAGIAVALAIGAVALLSLHHRNPATTTLPAALPPGIAARAPDPAGGLPWAIRVVRSSRKDLTCVQLGRLRGGSLGVIGEDGAFSNDGRFHPIEPSTVIAARCAPTDVAGHSFLNVEQPAQSASGFVTASDNQRVRCGVSRARRQPAVPVCPRRDMRFVQYGLLGPLATSITYTLDGRRYTSATRPDGAYLLVARASAAPCGQPGAPADCRHGREATTTGLPVGLVTTVTYRNGATCTPGLHHGFTDSTGACWPAGAQSLPLPSNPEPQVVSPITVRLIHASRYCFTTGAIPTVAVAPATETGPYIPCDRRVPPGDVPANPQPPADSRLVVFSWIAHKPVTSSSSGYEFLIDNPGNCGGGGSSTTGNIRAGERLTRGMFLTPRRGCTGNYIGLIFFTRNLRAGGPERVPGVARGSLLVGRFTFTLP